MALSLPKTIWYSYCPLWHAVHGFVRLAWTRSPDVDAVRCRVLAVW